MRRSLCSPRFGLALILLGGCHGEGHAPAPGAHLAAGSPWPKFRADAAQTGASSARPSDDAARTATFWRFPTGNGVFSSPIVAADGTIYVGSADRSFYALHPDGTLRWKADTGEIIDSAGLLDDNGNVYFGSGDGKLRALDAATGAPQWTFEADPPAKTHAFINWFEGNVAIAPNGHLYAPNDNDSLYAVDRDAGTLVWRHALPDQSWSLPAVDDATGRVYLGDNNLVPFLGDNTFALGSDGSALWSARSQGTNAASPLLTPDGKVIVGSFDGSVRAYDAAAGTLLWSFATRDHLYASPARLPDGTLIQASTDGTVYALRPADGTLLWAYDTRAPIRSSPAVDGDGNIYFGSSEGRLFVLNPDGTRRFALALPTDPRRDLNSSPALGAGAVYLGGESGEVWSVPYDYCMRPALLGSDACTTRPGADLPSDDASLYYTTQLGALPLAPPATIEANQTLAFTLIVRAAGATELALLDSASLKVTLEPPAPLVLGISGDRRYLTVTPGTGFVADAAGKVTMTIGGSYLVHPTRDGLRTSGGTVGGAYSTKLTFAVAPPSAIPLPLPIPGKPGDPAGAWEVSRLAAPLPTVLPSYNQIGFDSLHYLVGLVEGTPDHAVAWWVGARLDAAGRSVVDPSTRALFPLELSYRGGLLTLANQDGLRIEVLNITIPFSSLRITTRLDASGDGGDQAVLSASTVCGMVPTYGAFLQKLGLCNPETDTLSVFGAARVAPWQGGRVPAPSGVGTVTFDATATDLRATLTGSSLTPAAHSVALVAVDAGTGRPLQLDYGLGTRRATAADGTITAVSVPRGKGDGPAMARVYLMVDTYPAASGTVTLP